MRCTGLLLYATVGLLVASPVVASTQVETDPDTGIQAWSGAGKGFSIQLIQVVPDFVRAVYSARGLPEQLTQAVSSRCIFGTVIKNTSDVTISYDMRQWSWRDAQGTSHPFKLKSEWVEEWRDIGVSFRWTLLPDKNEFAVGDWGQGFITLDIAPGTLVDVDYSWVIDGELHEESLEGVRCVDQEAL